MTALVMLSFGVSNAQIKNSKTETHDHSNHTATTEKQEINQLKAVFEGYFTVKAVHELAQKKSIELPICAQVYAMLYEGQSAGAALSALMSRDLKVEGQ